MSFVAFLKGILLTSSQIDSNGTKEENIAGVEKTLRDSALWNRVVSQGTESVFLVSHRVPDDAQ